VSTIRGEVQWPELVKKARAGLTISYGDLKRLVKLKGWQKTFSLILSRIANYCHRKSKGWPILTVLVVNKKTGEPGNGIPFVSDFKSELALVHAFPWHNQRSPTAGEFPVSACWAHRATGSG
jgi:hypothetical protein